MLPILADNTRCWVNFVRCPGSSSNRHSKVSVARSSGISSTKRPGANLPDTPVQRLLARQQSCAAGAGLKWSVEGERCGRIVPVRYVSPEPPCESGTDVRVD